MTTVLPLSKQRVKGLFGRIRRMLRYSNQQTGITSLNEDVLYLIAQTLEFDTLQSFSATSRRIRGICLPILFRHYSIIGVDRSGPFPPPAHVSPFIQIYSYRHVRDVMDVQNFFRSIVSLVSVQTVQIQDAVCGVPTQCLTYCHFVPTLRSLEITDTHLTNLDPPNFMASSLKLRSLSRFVYSLNHWMLFRLAVGDKTRRAQGVPLSIPSEGLCNHLLEPMRKSLQSLEVCSHHGLFSWMSSVRWPRIRELCLDGMYLDEGDVRAIRSLLSNLPDLRVLGLKLARTADTSEPILVKRSRTTRITLNFLEQFTIAFPSPDDGIFDLLPTRLRHLSLRDWPRYYFVWDLQMAPSFLGINMPILAASECLMILRRCHCPHLRNLEVVYRADDGEDALFGHIVASFPSLKMFELHRYRSYADEDVPMEHIVQILAKLNSLCSLRLNLDLTAHQLHPYMWITFSLEPVKKDMIYRAERCAEIIGPNLKEVSFIFRMHAKNEWIVWRLQRSDKGVVSARQEKSIRDASCRNDIRGPTEW